MYDFSDIIFIFKPILFLFFVIIGLQMVTKILHPQEFSFIYFIIFILGLLLLATSFYCVFRLFFTFIEADSDRYNDLQFIKKSEINQKLVLNIRGREYTFRKKI